MSKVDQKYAAKWDTIVSRNFKGQACWFLNGFWNTHEQEAETIWKYVQTANELCKAKKAEGSELDEFEAHVFLEKLSEIHTVVELRKKLATIDIDMNRRMALIEYLIFKYDKDLPSVINAPQGGENKEDLAKAEALVAESEALLQAAIQSEAAAKQAEAAAAAAKAAAEESEAAAFKAEEEQKAALEELKAQQDAHTNKIASLEAIAQDESKSTVAKSRAANEAAQMKAQDPLPLQRAKINQGATVRTAERARKFANEQADLARSAHASAVKSRQEAEESLERANAKFAEALAYLEEVKSRPGASFGDIWWMERELLEKRKYMPKSKGGNW